VTRGKMVPNGGFQLLHVARKLEAAAEIGDAENPFRNVDHQRFVGRGTLQVGVRVLSDHLGRGHASGFHLMEDVALESSFKFRPVFPLEPKFVRVEEEESLRGRRVWRSHRESE
jgi:hypothetical protein